ncbi:hypothetical protein EG68_02826 [Paragonimus skrjabini miyazakii]|uniref:Uncharacterized protein n=1 Tax=Paragonimus skrjabini miyazakii TaxID=59628 RepID=A0A8S9YY04_9TREM|nr:hypothetical protein EG68_02826 [Paragonimus skrjabini miyazakii]
MLATLAHSSPGAGLRKRSMGVPISPFLLAAVASSINALYQFLPCRHMMSDKFWCSKKDSVIPFVRSVLMCESI